jgi:hypothetical protein
MLKSKVKVTRATQAIWLVGGTEETFKSSKLPSRGDVLKVLFHYHDRQKMSLKDSITRTSEMLLELWDKARVPTKAATHVVEHIRKLHAEWQGLKKRISRTSASNLSNQQMFRETLDDLFDVAHRDAMSIMKIDEDRKFLEAQREKGRRGLIGGVDRTLALREERTLKRTASAETFAMKAKSALASATAVAVLDDSSSDSNTVISSDSEACPSTSKVQKLRGTIALVTPQVAAALDRTNTSDTKAAHIFSAMASSSLNQNVEELIISRSAIRRARMKHREAFTSEVKATFDPKVSLILHWDGKVMDDFTGPGRERIDRLPVLVSGHDVVKLLSVPKLEDGTAATMTREIVATVDEWGLRDRLRACVLTLQHQTLELLEEFVFV